MHPPMRFPIPRTKVTASPSTLRLGLGLALALVSWWTAWFGPAPFSHHTFFPLWLGYILAVDGWTARRSGTSLLQRSPRQFALLFVYSVPLWWLFEFANHYLGNWRYLLPRPYEPLEYTFLATVSFSTVMPAIFVTAELLRTISVFRPRRHWRRVDFDARALVVISLAGAAMFALSLAFPRYCFPLVWIGLFLALDPLNALIGNPSLTAQLRQGRWDTMFALFAAGHVCGFFWEMWNAFSMPKWVYEVPFVGRLKFFEMPLLGYGGYLPFSLEVFAVWSLLSRIFPEGRADWLRFTQPYVVGQRSTAAASDRRC